MILETSIFLIGLCFIAVLFYKQANEQFTVLQLDAERIDELPTLYSDLSPIVLRNIQVPCLGTQAELQKRPQILNMAVAPKLSLQALLYDKQKLSSFTLSHQTAEFLAKEAGLPVWAEKELIPHMYPALYSKWMYSSKVSLWPHHRGLFKTTAYQTLLLPTQGKAVVSLLLESQEAYLPSRWKGRPFLQLTTSDTPLLNQIKYMDIVLRKGNALVLPPHMIVDIHGMEQEEDVWTAIVELHHPISYLASMQP